MNCLCFSSPLGCLTLIEDGGSLTSLRFGGSPGGELTPLLSEAQRQLCEYFAGERREFSLPLNPRGTEFQKRVWRALETIPYGETRCYQQIAEAIGQPRATRAVGMANNRNPLPILIPCHRVIGKDGSLTGYGGGLDIKKALLSLETGRSRT